MHSHISVGMQLELVLNEDEKKERFKASLAKKNREEDVPYRAATSQTRFEEQRSSVSVEISLEEPINLILPNPMPRALVPPFQTTASSYNNRPTGTVALMLNSSAGSTWTSTSIREANISTLPSRLEQNTSLFSRFERNTNSFRPGQNPISKYNQ